MTLQPRGDVIRALPLAVLSGLLIFASLAPRSLWPVGLIALVPLLLAIRHVSWPLATLSGWLTGFIAMAAAAPWSLEELDGSDHAASGSRTALWLFNAAYQGLPFALWAGGARFLVTRGLHWLLALPLCVLIAEPLLPVVVPSSLSVVIVSAWPLIQVAELGGPTTVAALLVLIDATALELFLERRARQPVSLENIRALVVITVLIAAGGLRAAHVEWLRADAPRLQVGLVQPNFGPSAAPERRRGGDAIIATLRQQTEALGARGATLVVWPSRAFPAELDATASKEFPVGHSWNLRGRYEGALLFGSLTRASDGSAELRDSAVLIAPDGTLAGAYDKQRLVAADGKSDVASVTAGADARVLTTDTLKVGPMLGHEELLPTLTWRLIEKSPNVLVTLGGDSRGSMSAAPHMALALATFRAIEARRDFVRVTVAGISSSIDALGRVGERAQVKTVADAPDAIITEVALLETTALGVVGRLTPWSAAIAVVVLLRRARNASDEDDS